MNQLVKMEKTACTSSMSNGNSKTADSRLQIIRRQSHCRYGNLTWFDTKVFYVRISNFAVLDDSIPECLTLNHVPVNPHTLLEINGSKCSILSKGESSLLRRDRADKRTEEATFVSTDCIRLTGSVKFEVVYKEDVIISGILEMSNSNGTSEESNINNDTRRWSLNCDIVKSPGLELFKGGKTGRMVSETVSPTIEVYVAGCVSGSPIILTKTLRQKKNSQMRTLNSIPESDGGSQEPFETRFLMNTSGYRNFEAESEEDYNNDVNWRDQELDCIDGDYGELNWFAAGVRVGVGIGLGICLGVGIGVGVMLRSYAAATRNFRRQLL